MTGYVIEIKSSAMQVYLRDHYRGEGGRLDMTFTTEADAAMQFTDQPAADKLFKILKQSWLAVREHEGVEDAPEKQTTEGGE